MSKNIVRILLLGKTGVGKSSFINYFLDDNVAKTQAGLPCTQEFDKYVYNYLKECDIELWDSKGLEVLDFDRGRQVILDSVGKRNNGSFENWYHTIFYCVSAKKKVEEQEIKFINDVKTCANHGVHIILTNCDGESETKLKDYEDYLKKSIGDNVRIYRVISIEKKKRNGEITVRTGREEILTDVFKLLWVDIADYIASNVSDYICTSAIQCLNRAEQNVLYWADNNLGGFSIILKLIKSIKDGNSDDFDEIFDSSIPDNMYDSLDRIVEQCKAVTKEELKVLNNIYSSYYSLYNDEYYLDENAIIDNIFDKISDILSDNFGEDMLYNNVSLVQIEEIDDVNLGTIFKGISSIFKLKKELKNCFSLAFKSIRTDIYNFNIKRLVYADLIRANELCNEISEKVDWEIERDERLKEFRQEMIELEIEENLYSDKMAANYTRRVKNRYKIREYIIEEQNFDDETRCFYLTPYGIKKLGYDPETHDAVYYKEKWRLAEYVDDMWQLCDE